MGVFKVLGVALACCVVVAVWQGRVYVKSGPAGHWVERDRTPAYFWTCVAIYAALAIALATVF